MSDVIAETRTWPCAPPMRRIIAPLLTHIPYWSERWLYIEPSHVSLAYYDDGKALLRRKPGWGELFDTSLIRSIEIDNAAEFEGEEAWEGDATILDRAPDQGDAFIQAMGLRTDEVWVHWIEGLCIWGAALFLIWCTLGSLGVRYIGWAHGVSHSVNHAIGLDALPFVGSALSVWGWISVVCCVAYLIYKLYCLSDWALDALGDSRRSFRYHNTRALFVVLYLANGERRIVATAYQNRGLVLEMQNDHLAAWDTAKRAALTRHAAADYL
jgi:hypothetical protein